MTRQISLAQNEESSGKDAERDQRTLDKPQFSHWNYDIVSTELDSNKKTLASS